MDSLHNPPADGLNIGNSTRPGLENTRLTLFAIYVEAFQASVVDESNYPFLFDNTWYYKNE